jgi:hypothetical protein
MIRKCGYRFSEKIMLHQKIQSMIRKSMPSGIDPMGGCRLSEKHALGLDPRDHAPPKI